MGKSAGLDVYLGGSLVRHALLVVVSVGLSAVSQWHPSRRTAVKFGPFVTGRGRTKFGRERWKRRLLSATQYKSAVWSQLCLGLLQRCFGARAMISY